MTVAIEVGSANVYADLGHLDAEEMQRKATMAAEIVRAIEAGRLTHTYAERSMPRTGWVVTRATVDSLSINRWL